MGEPQNDVLMDLSDEAHRSIADAGQPLKPDELRAAILAESVAVAQPRTELERGVAEEETKVLFRSHLRHVSPGKPEGEWVSVAETAKALKVSERAIQKRCAAGKLVARRIDTPQGKKWEIDANQLPRTHDILARTDERTSELSSRTGEPANVSPEPTNFHPQNDPNQRTNGTRTAELGREPANELDANGRTESPEPANAITARYVEHLEGEVEHLRGQIEAQRAEYLATIEAERRESALTIAALRDAIKAMPKALTVGDESKSAGAAAGDTTPSPWYPPGHRDSAWRRFKVWLVGG